MWITTFFVSEPFIEKKKEKNLLHVVERLRKMGTNMY